MAEADVSTSRTLKLQSADACLQRGAGELAGVEVKASGKVREATLRFAPDLFAVPLRALWDTPAAA